MIFRYIEEKNDPDSPGFFISWLKDKIPVFGIVFKERWFDIGSFENYDAACRYYERKNKK